MKTASSLLLLVFAWAAVAQENSATTVPAALMAAQFAAVLNGGSQISDVTLTGTATWIKGADREEGSFVAKAKGQGQARLDLSLSGGTRSQIHTTSPLLKCAEIGPDGTVQPLGNHNCWTDASWFFPALTSIAFTSDSSRTFTNVGQVPHEGTTSWHIQSNRSVSRDAASAVGLRYLAAASAVHYYFDSSSRLPQGMMFSVHPPKDGSATIPAEIRYADYRNVNGVQVPYDIQRYENGVLTLELTVTSVAVNTGLTDADFIVPE